MTNQQTNYSRWVEVDLGAIAHNVVQVRKLLDPGVKLLAVVKADGYGHGLVPVAWSVLLKGADMLGVTHPEEGVRLRKAGITAPVLIFRPSLPGEEELLAAYGLTPSVSSLEQATALSAEAQRTGRLWPVHLKVETGMGRTGFLPEELVRQADRLRSLPGLVWEGIYSHLAAAVSDPAFTREQYRRFCQVLKLLEEDGWRFRLRHICNSAAILLYPEMHLDMVRAGNLLYGQLPDRRLKNRLDLKDPWSFWTRVVHLQRVKKGATVGYGRTYRARRDTVLAVLPVGYSDGFGVDVTPHPAGFLDLVRVLVKTAGAYFGIPWGTSFVSIRGRSAPVVGRVGMELSCVDVGKLPDIEVGDPVRLQARRTVISAKVPRVLVGGEELPDGALWLHQEPAGLEMEHLRGDYLDDGEV